MVPTKACIGLDGLYEHRARRLIITAGKARWALSTIAKPKASQHGCATGCSLEVGEGYWIGAVVCTAASTIMLGHLATCVSDPSRGRKRNTALSYGPPSLTKM
jgi:hypothetical protein